LDPSDVIVTFPVELPPAAGANFTEKVTVCPAERVAGNVNPLRLYPLPDADAAVIFTSDPPELVNVSLML